MFVDGNVSLEKGQELPSLGGSEFRIWRGRDGNDPSVDIAKDADQRF
jgi:hypothetical protein